MDTTTVAKRPQRGRSRFVELTSNSGGERRIMISPGRIVSIIPWSNGGSLLRVSGLRYELAVAESPEEVMNLTAAA